VADDGPAAQLVQGDYMVLPMRPAGTDGWSEEKLAGLVTRDAMIGTDIPKVKA
jgi:nitrile hydratase